MALYTCIRLTGFAFRFRFNSLEELIKQIATDSRNNFTYTLGNIDVSDARFVDAKLCWKRDYL